VLHQKAAKFRSDGIPRFGRKFGALAIENANRFCGSSFGDRSREPSNPSYELLTLYFYIARQRAVSSTNSAQLIGSQLVRQLIRVSANGTPNTDGCHTCCAGHFRNWPIRDTAIPLCLDQSLVDSLASATGSSFRGVGDAQPVAGVPNGCRLDPQSFTATGYRTSVSWRIRLM